ncbi:MAG: hypothetical protein JW922_01920 [Paludibacteraceae bacterium]|nr:hypothetical protein [Paludibacteraceae bacterium]
MYDEKNTIKAEWPWSGPSFAELRNLGELPISDGMGALTTYIKEKAELQEAQLLDSEKISEELQKIIGEHTLIMIDTPELKPLYNKELVSAGVIPKVPDFIAVNKHGYLFPIDSKRDLYTADVQQIDATTVKKLLESITFRSVISPFLGQKIGVDDVVCENGFFVTAKNQTNLDFWSKAAVEKRREWEVLTAEAEAETDTTLSTKILRDQVIFLELSWREVLPKLPGWGVAEQLIHLDYPDATDPLSVVDIEGTARRDSSYYGRLGAACLSLAQRAASPIFKIEDTVAVNEYISHFLEKALDSGEVYANLMHEVGAKDDVEVQLEEPGISELKNFGIVKNLLNIKLGDAFELSDDFIVVPKQKMGLLARGLSDNWLAVLSSSIKKTYPEISTWVELRTRLNEDNEKNENAGLKDALAASLKEEISTIASQ